MSFSDWLLRPLSNDPDAARGDNNLGLIGAALKDAGKHLNGEPLEARALQRFEARVQHLPSRTAAVQAPGRRTEFSGLQPRILGLLSPPYYG